MFPAKSKLSVIIGVGESCLGLSDMITHLKINVLLLSLCYVATCGGGLSEGVRVMACKGGG